MSILGSLVKKTVDLPKEHLEVHKLALDAMAESQELLEKLSKMRDERDALKEEVKSLREKADRQKDLERAEGVFFRLAPDRRSLEEVPYCQVCWENEAKLFRMFLTTDQVFYCPECYRVQRGTPYHSDLVRGMWKGATSRLAQRAAGQQAAAHE